MKVDKQELQQALAAVKPGLASKEFIEQSTSFAFLGDRVVTYDDEISISHPVKNLDVTGAIKAQALYEFLNRVKRDQIELVWEEDQVKIHAGRSTAGLVFEQEVKLPVEEVGEIGEWEKLPEDFVTALSYGYPCCSKEMSRPVLTCLNVNGDKVEASDALQIIRYQMKDALAIDRFLIPATAAQELTRYDITHIAGGAGWVHFKTEDGTVFSSRVFEGEYPTISPHLHIEDAQEINFPRTIPQALERAQVFAQESTGMIPMATIAIEEGQVKISAQSTSGWFEERIKTKYKGGSVRFQAGVESLINLLTHTRRCELGDGRIKFTGDDWEHVVATVEDE